MIIYFLIVIIRFECYQVKPWQTSMKGQTLCQNVNPRIRHPYLTVENVVFSPYKKRKLTERQNFESWT